MATDRVKVVIDRAKWDRGKTYARPDCYRALRNQAGGKCCLGFACIALGLTDEQIETHGSPADLDNDIAPRLFFSDFGAERDAVVVAIESNDDPTISEAEREALVVKHFGELGLDVEFVGEGMWSPVATGAAK